MIRVLLTILVLSAFALSGFSVQARERSVSNISKTEIFSEGLYFKICDIKESQTVITVTVQAKNKSMLSQAVYVELADEIGNNYKPQNKDSVNFFRPLKFNKPITQNMSFKVQSVPNKYWLAVYSKDLFKKNKKQIITKMSLSEAEKELKMKHD